MEKKESSLNLNLDNEAYEALTFAATASFRSLRKEATLRIIDHIHRFDEKCDVEFGHEDREVRITLPITDKQKVKHCLYRGSYQTRTLSEECSLRLKQHLLLFPYISAVGVVMRNTKR